MTNAIIEKAKERFAHSHESLAREFGSIRAGRANASLLDRITVEYYGAPTPLNQLASITVPEARVLLISPFDKGSIADIERAINESDLGINPANDGSVVRLVIPALTEETRKELAKEVKKVGENAKIAIRNIRRDAMDEAKKQEKDKEITGAMVALGGSIAVYGEKSDGSDWNVGIQDPNGKDGEVLGGIKVKSGTSISTSGDYRFGHEMHVAGSDTLIILQGINDIIHPVGVEKNEFRPWQDLPSSQELIEGLKKYVKHAKSLGMKVYIGTLIPIEGWRTYAYFRENLRNEVNEWIRTTDEIDGVIDFDKDICDGHKMQDAFDSGDHLHPSDEGYAQMAKTAYNKMSME